jgi:hypothetical protein
LGELVEQARFTDACLAGQHNDESVSAPGGLNQFVELL